MKNQTVILVGAAAGVALVALASRAPRALGRAANAINPFNPNNAIYAGVNELGARATDDSSFNLGARAWEWFNPDEREKERALFAPSLPRGVGDRDDADAGRAMRDFLDYNEQMRFYSQW